MIAPQRTCIDVEVIVDVAIIEAIDDELIDDFVAPILNMCLQLDARLIGFGGEFICVDTSEHAGTKCAQQSSQCELGEAFTHALILSEMNNI